MFNCVLQLGLSKTHRLRWFEESGRHLLHELATTDTLLHEYSEEGNYTHLLVYRMSSTVMRDN